MRVLRESLRVLHVRVNEKVISRGRGRSFGTAGTKSARPGGPTPRRRELESAAAERALPPRKRNGDETERYRLESTLSFPNARVLSVRISSLLLSSVRVCLRAEPRLDALVLVSVNMWMQKSCRCTNPRGSR